MIPNDNQYHDQAARNANDAVSLLQTTEGPMQEFVNKLYRIRNLTEQFINSATSIVDRAVNEAVQQLILQLNIFANETTDGDMKMLNTTDGYSTTYSIRDDVVLVSVLPVRSTDLGISSKFSTIMDESDSNFASRLCTQFASIISRSTLFK